MFEDDISILTQEALGPDEDWLDSPNTDLSGEMCSASHFALITAYDDIKNRLTGLERENSTLKRRLKMYEVKVRARGARGARGAGGTPLTACPGPQYPLIGEFGEEHIFSLYEAKENSLLKSEKASLQQQLNQFQHEVRGTGGLGGLWGVPEAAAHPQIPPISPAAAEEQRAGGAAGGDDPGLREAVRGEGGPGDRAGRDGG